MGKLLLLVSQFAGLFVFGVGLLTVYYWIAPPKHGKDKSNRINNVVDWWTFITGRKASDYTQTAHAKQDVVDNIRDVQAYRVGEAKEHPDYDLPEKWRVEKESGGGPIDNEN